MIFDSMLTVKIKLASKSEICYIIIFLDICVVIIINKFMEIFTIMPLDSDFMFYYMNTSVEIDPFC